MSRKVRAIRGRRRSAARGPARPLAESSIERPPTRCRGRRGRLRGSAALASLRTLIGRVEAVSARVRRYRFAAREAESDRLDQGTVATPPTTLATVSRTRGATSVARGLCALVAICRRSCPSLSRPAFCATAALFAAKAWRARPCCSSTVRSWYRPAGPDHPDRRAEQHDDRDEGERLLFGGSWHGEKDSAFRPDVPAPIPSLNGCELFVAWRASALTSNRASTPRPDDLQDCTEILSIVSCRVW